MTGSWLLGNPVPLSDGLKDLEGDFLVAITDTSIFKTNLQNVGFQQRRHFLFTVIDNSYIGSLNGFTAAQRFPLTVVSNSIISSQDKGGFVQGKVLHFQLWIHDTSFFLVTFKSVRFKLWTVDTSLVYIRFLPYAPATAQSNFATYDNFIAAIPGSLNFDPQVQAIGLVNDNSIYTLTGLADRVRVLCNIMQQEETSLDLLAFQFDVLFYQGANLVVDPVARINLKKNLIAQSYGINSKLGTPGIIQRVISQIYGTAIMQEWWRYGGAHDHFRIYTENAINDPKVIQSLSVALFSVIRASQAFDGYFTMVPCPVNLYLSVCAYCEMEVFSLPCYVSGTPLTPLS